ncbi:DUF6226 family protein [Puerhibacterium puerhi]|uniref:DUF6226 family protein n=1 Tax=Puerhibacterium puerhi TaxID=2692623 RepID=UPI001359458F|nr:DUF6226 family protein [Puerhibacterium puerhi]
MAYVRPDLPRQVFTDAAGRPIPYGHRWDHLDGPPEAAYSVAEHPERFAPLHDVADALVAHLAATYAVEVATVGPRDLRGPAADRALRAARLTPSSPDAAPLTVVRTDLPGVVVEAGALLVEPFPVCGCDACDDPLERVVEDLEETVGAVVTGSLHEWVRGGRLGRQFWVGHALSVPGGTRSGEGRRSGPRAQLLAARERLAALPGGRWQPWARAAADA